MSTTTKSIKRNKQLPAHSVSIEIYSGIARFSCDSTAFLYLNIVVQISVGDKLTQMSLTRELTHSL